MAWLKTKNLLKAYDSTQSVNTHKCKKIKQWLISSAGKYISPEAPWLQRHVAKCPRCQSRLASIARVNLALSFTKSQPHNLDLLMRANSRTIGVLEHSLRENLKAQKLKKMSPEPRCAQRLIQCLQPSGNLAACFLIVFLMKFGIFSSMENIQIQGKKAYKQYYVSHIGEEMTKDIFPGSFS